MRWPREVRGRLRVEWRGGEEEDEIENNDDKDGGDGCCCVGRGSFSPFFFYMFRLTGVT